MRGPGSQLSSLKWECGNRVRRSTQESKWIPQLNLPIIKLFPTLGFQVYTLITLPLKELLLFPETDSKWGTMPWMNLFPKLKQRETALCIPAELAKFVVLRWHKDSLYCDTELEPITSRCQLLGAGDLTSLVFSLSAVSAMLQILLMISRLSRHSTCSSPRWNKGWKRHLLCCSLK